ncbi:insulin-like growth factor 3 [Alosa sapidissima]|uniref:insulin-like growth factor 3 n=1 Tax=Alosa sapidissima TaxID=34773 RepID=UPI001C08020A|nr:insulin-like growth factor 3 [Alosa sapidissima]
MPSTESRPSGTSAGGCMLKVLCWQCVCWLCPFLLLLSLPEHTHAGRPRCGIELMADLEFVCGDRGFYRGRTGGRRGLARARGKGIIDQCCVKGGCDLQYLESYCAKPKRKRRHAADAAQHDMELMFRALFVRRYTQQASHMADRHEERTQFLKTRRDSHKLTEKQPPLPEQLNDDASLQHSGSSTTEQHHNSDPPLQPDAQPMKRTCLPAFG